MSVILLYLNVLDVIVYRTISCSSALCLLVVGWREDVSVQRRCENEHKDSMVALRQLSVMSSFKIAAQCAFRPTLEASFLPLS